MWSIIVLFLLGLAGCTTDAALTNGRYLHTIVTEVRSPFGTNMGFAKVEECARATDQQNVLTYRYTDCVDRSGLIPMSSQGQGGQIAQGVLIGAGVGAGAAVAGGVSQSVTTIQSVTNAVAKGHH